MLFLFTIMLNKPLHIISFDNPFPANYGGVIDVFYKLKSLHDLGYAIHFHCFYDERNVVSDELKAITEKVYLYKKNRNPLFLFSNIPFGIISRFHKSLIHNIEAIDAPILFEGLQSTMVLHKAKLQGKKYLRLHNLESKFYSGMFQSETQWIKKIMYYLEVRKYKEYEKQLHHFNHVFTLSVHEKEVVKSWSDSVTYVPVFNGNKKVMQISEQGDYALYHGDLRLPDNKRAVRFLIKIFQKIPNYKLIIASSNGKDFVTSQIKNFTNIEFVIIDSESHLDTLLENAHINVLLSFQQSGTKLKLINSLFKSRFCLINENMVDDKNILQLCEMASSEGEFITKINELKSRPYLDNLNRKEILSQVLDDQKNAQVLASIIEADKG